MTTKPRIIGIDLLRVVCIFYIVAFWHLMDQTTAFPLYSNIITLKLTLIALGTFVFIAGYFIGLQDIKRRGSGLLSFYAKKFLRIYPLFLIASALFVLLGLAKMIPAINAACLISMFTRTSPPTLWFVSMLLVFYLVSPVINAFLRKEFDMQLITLTSIVTIGIAAYFHITRMLDVRIMGYFLPFIAGMYVGTKDDDEICPKIFIYLLLAVSIGISFVQTNNHKINSALNMPVIVMCSYCLYLSFSKLNFTSERVNKTISVLSYSSFSMYLFHRPIFIILKSIYFPKSEALQLVYLYLLCIPVIIIASYGIQFGYDKLKNRIIHSHLSSNP